MKKKIENEETTYMRELRFSRHNDQAFSSGLSDKHETERSHSLGRTTSKPLPVTH